MSTVKHPNERYGSMFPHGGAKGTGLSSFPKLDGSNPVHVAAVGVLNEYGQLLVGYNHKRRVWDVPQGVAEGGETADEAACRELSEETDLIVTPGDLVPVSTFQNLTSDFVFTWTTTLYVLRSDFPLHGIYNKEPDRCTDLGFYAPVQIPQPRGMSLRVLLELLGRG